jgi:hypothetical protein
MKTVEKTYSNYEKKGEKKLIPSDQSTPSYTAALPGL